MPTPTIGRIVHVLGISSNGAIVHPAMITRVWSETTVNLTVLPDCGDPKCFTSVGLCADETTANHYIAKAHEKGNPAAVVAFWPVRT
jgi:hypothetical protein